MHQLKQQSVLKTPQTCRCAWFTFVNWYWNMSKRESAVLLLHKAVFHPDFLYFLLYLMRQMPNKGGDSGNVVGEELDALFHAVSLWLVVQRLFLVLWWFQQMTTFWTLVHLLAETRGERPRSIKWDTTKREMWTFMAIAANLNFNLTRIEHKKQWLGNVWLMASQ